MSNKSARWVAARVLASVAKGESLGAALPAQLPETPLAQRPLAQELVYGTLREWPRLAGIAQQLLKKPLKTKDSDVYSLMLMGLHQIAGMRVPDHAAVSETVNIARKLGKPWATGLINGVLRSYQRDSTVLEANLSPASRAAMPDWLFETIGTQWHEHQDRLVSAARHRPPMTLRVNLSKTTRAECLKRLNQEGIEGSTSAQVESAITLSTPRDVKDLPGFSTGLMSVQDESAQLAAVLLAPAAGEKILDACAAPGGKACHLLETQPSIDLTAADISESRLGRIVENRDRLGLDLSLVALDAAQGSTLFGDARFDAILADVPCSATGVIRRHPDIKLHRHAEDIEHFTIQQHAILQGLWPTLKPGGRLLYVTCSVLEEENDAIVRGFLTTVADCVVGEISAPDTIKTELGIQRLPNPEGGDGLYFALLERGLP